MILSCRDLLGCSASGTDFTLFLQCEQATVTVSGEIDSEDESLEENKDLVEDEDLVEVFPIEFVFTIPGWLSRKEVPRVISPSFSRFPENISDSLVDMCSFYHNDSRTLYVSHDIP